MFVFPRNDDQLIIFTSSLNLATYIERLASHTTNESLCEWQIQSNESILRDLARIAEESHGQSYPTHFCPDVIMLIRIAGVNLQVIFDIIKSVKKYQVTHLPSNQCLFANPS